MKLKSSEPFWLVKNGIINAYPSLNEDISTEILVVGSGITGSLIAHQCIKDGYNTTLIDRREIANGSTSATTSMLQYEIDVPLYELIDLIGEKPAVESYQACFDSIDTLAQIVKEIQSKCGFVKKDSLYFAALKKDVAWLKEEYQARKKHGFPVTWLQAEEINKQYTISKTYGGILSKQGASIDAFQLAHDLLQYNHKKGLQIFDKTNIEEISYTSKGVTVTTQYGNTIKAKKIIYCNGFESTEIIKDNFVKLLSTYAIVGEPYQDKQDKLNKTLFWNTAEPYMYMRTTDDGRLLIGGEDEDFVNPQKRDKLIANKTKKLEKQIHKYLPNYNFRTDFSWAGTFGETKDGLPYIGKHPNFESTLFVLGFGGNGITFSVIGMQIVSDMLKNKTNKLSNYFKFNR